MDVALALELSQGRVLLRGPLLSFLFGVMTWIPAWLFLRGRGEGEKEVLRRGEKK